MADLVSSDEDRNVTPRKFKRLRRVTKKEASQDTSQSGHASSAPVPVVATSGARASDRSSHASSSSARSSAPSGYRQSAARAADPPSKPRLLDEDIFELSCDEEGTQASYWPAEARTTARSKPRPDEDIFELSCDEEGTQASHWPAEARTTANKPGIGKSDDVENKRTELAAAGRKRRRGEQEVIELFSSDEENELREKPRHHPSDKKPSASARANESGRTNRRKR
ncbi:hypothetical protein THAOC_08796 [Thalassiosira oceanica]|uniref:Uncharacterized protein n=1 Tax=Thalassiosira oceanica TaxID=159749 RepID=K0SWU4_THAOC|nr:hypothetical protein THAOC_08796 [Thalassiosira oceanica]|eukprot:EJK69905.1 hypothetical protein THAOC_08796 [Thalassiosira oceanica]